MLATFSQHRQTCTMYLLVFEQRFVAKNSTSLNLTKRSQTRVIEHSIYYSFRGLTAQQQYLQKSRMQYLLLYESVQVNSNF